MQLSTLTIKSFTSRYLLLAFSLGSSLLFSSCEDGGADAASPEPTLLEDLSEQPQLSSFEAALHLDSINYAGSSSPTYSERIGNRRVTYTVFAPSDEAVNAWLLTNNLSSLNDLEKEQLHQFVGNHILQSAYVSSVLGSGELITLSGQTIGFSTETDENNKVVYFVNDSIEYVASDILSANGYIHIVDEVLTFPAANRPLGQRLAELNEFRTLAEQLARPAVKSLLDSLQNNNLAFTLFAPTNEALANFAQQNNLSSASELTDSAFSVVLRSHILEGSIAELDFNQGDYIALSDSVLQVTTDPVLMINGVEPTATYRAGNGIIYAVPQVIPFQD
jgi:uncharacterized surface protein with fasciclin (FAS1) repeats